MIDKSGVPYNFSKRSHPYIFSSFKFFLLIRKSFDALSNVPYPFSGWGRVSLMAYLFGVGGYALTPGFPAHCWEVHGSMDKEDDLDQRYTPSPPDRMIYAF